MSPNKHLKLHAVPKSEEFMHHAMSVHGHSVYTVALAQTKQVQDAQDVVQEVYLRLLRTSTTFTSEEHLRAWLLRVTLNLCASSFRSGWKKHVQSVDTFEREPQSTAPTPEEEVLANMQQSPVWKALNELSDKLRIVALLYYVEELTCEQIAVLLEISPSGVRTRLHRARAELKKILDQQGEEYGQEAL